MSNINKNGTWNTGEIINEKNYTNLLEWEKSSANWCGLNVTFSNKNIITLNGTLTRGATSNYDSGYIKAPLQFETNIPYTFYIKYISGTLTLKEGGTASNYAFDFLPAKFSNRDAVRITPENYQETKYITTTFNSSSGDTGLDTDFWKDYVCDHLVYECGIIQSDTLDTNVKKVKIFNDKIEALDFIEI